VDIIELVRQKRAGVGHREIGRRLGITQPTVRKYVRWAADEGFLVGDVPDGGVMEARLATTLPQGLPPQQTSTLADYSDVVKEMRARGIEMAAIRLRLEERYGVVVSYEAIRRLVRRLEPKRIEAFVRVETPPGEEAQVDFGYVGLTIDPATGRLRKTWAFVIVLAHSRHMYVEFVHGQAVGVWLLCHAHAFAWFGGVPQRIVLDNLKTAILKACRDDPAVQRSYREFAEHYGFLIDPNPPASPHLKGKVEQGGVHYVKRNFMAGREPESTDVLNAKVIDWCIGVAGARRHGTTMAAPLERFESLDQPALLPLPREPYDLGVWKQVTLYRDCHITFERAWYSAPFRLVGTRVWARGGARTVKIYTAEHELVATHDTAAPGERRTCLDHLPPEKVAGITLDRQTCRARARAIGPATAEIAGALLDSRPVDKLRSAERLLDLARPFGAERLERACAMAIAYGDNDNYVAVKSILQAGIDKPAPAPLPPRTTMFTHARAAIDYVVAVAGVGR